MGHDHRRLIIVALVLTLAGGCAPAAKKVDAAREGKQQAAEEQPPAEKKGPTGGIVRKMEVTAAQNTLRQLGLAYRNFEVTENRGPKNQKELGPYYENNNAINEALSKQWITFIWGASRQSFAESGASQTVLAYETDADRNGLRMVLMADGSVQAMNESDFKKAPRAKGK